MADGRTDDVMSRSAVQSFRRRAGFLDTRLAPGSDALRRAAHAGLQDSMPRAALASLHARVEAVPPTVLDDPALVQVWGPRFQVYVVADTDIAVFTLGRLPTDPRGRRRAEDLAARLRDLLADGEELAYGEAGRALDVHHNSLRYAGATGSVLLRWDGARQATIRVEAPPDVDPRDARCELARRHLHASGPTTPEAFARWAGVARRQARTTFDELRDELVEVVSPIGPGWILAEDEPLLRSRPAPATTVRLLPSGDPYWLLHGDQRDLLVEDASRRDQLWTPRVWPGALLVDGEIVGTWRRAGTRMEVEPWRRLSTTERDAVEAEAASLPLPGLADDVVVDWAA